MGCAATRSVAPRPGLGTVPPRHSWRQRGGGGCLVLGRSNAARIRDDRARLTRNLHVHRLPVRKAEVRVLPDAQPLAADFYPALREFAEEHECLDLTVEHVSS